MSDRYVVIERSATTIEIWENCRKRCGVFHKKVAECHNAFEAARIVAALRDTEGERR